MNNLEYFILKLFSHGDSVAVVIFGRRGTGKTDNALFIAEILEKHHKVFDFATNIHVYKSLFPIEYITNMEDLETWASVGARRKLFILDEAGKAFKRRSPMSKLNLKIMDNLQTLRKFKLSIIFIAPDEKYIDSAGLGSDVLDGIIFKPEFKNPKVALYHDLQNYSSEAFTNLPQTNIEFNTWDIATFTLKSDKPKTPFTDKELAILEQLGGGVLRNKIPYHHEEINRTIRKFAKLYIEYRHHKKEHKANEVSTPKEVAQFLGD